VKGWKAPTVLGLLETSCSLQNPDDRQIQKFSNHEYCMVLIKIFLNPDIIFMQVLNN
jgi:hypothetical protein